MRDDLRSLVCRDGIGGPMGGDQVGSIPSPF